MGLERVRTRKAKIHSLAVFPQRLPFLGCLGAVGGTLETREDAFRAGFWRFVRVRARHRTRGLLSPLSSLVENEDGGGEN